MNDIKNKIFRLTQKLQTQTHLPLWKLANEQVGYSAATGEKIVWGPKMGILRRIMNVAYKINATDVILFFVGLSRAISIWWSVKKAIFKTKKKKKTIFKRIFSGFGASSEEYLYADYVNQSKEQTLRINWITHDGVSELGCPSLISIFYLVARNAFGYTAKLRDAIHEVSSNAVDFMTVYAFNLGTYSFYRSFWRMARLYGANEVVVLALDIPAYACVDEGINTVYLQHGLMALSIPIPKLHRIDVLTSDEESFLKSTLNNVQILRTTKVIKNDSVKNNVLMILSLNVFQEERLLTCEPLIRLATRMGLQIILRPTPKVTQEKLTVLLRRIPQALFDDLTIPLHNSFEKWRPKLVAAWTSTGLATALDYGCVPISLNDPEVNNVWDNMIYPMKNRVLFWPRDESLIEIAIQSENAYHSQLANLRSYQENYFN